MSKQRAGHTPGITQSEIDAMRLAGRAVAVYPRKGVAVVDGFKRFKIVEPSRARCPDCGIPTVPDHEGLTADDMRCDSCDGGE